MFWKRKKTQPTVDFDREQLIPVIRCSICTGEEVAGFQEIATGKFREDRLLGSEQDLEEFMAQYGLTQVPRRIY